MHEDETTEETVEDLEQTLAKLRVREESIKKFSDPSMRELQLRWLRREIKEVERKLDNRKSRDGAAA